MELRRKNKNARHGLTFVEVMVGIVIIGTLSVSTLTLTDAQTSTKVELAQQLIAADLENIRQLAVANNTQYTVTFDFAANTYTLQHTGTNSTFNQLPKSAFQAQTGDGTTLTTSLNELPLLNGVKVYALNRNTGTSREAMTAVSFTPLGTTTETNMVEVWLNSGTKEASFYANIKLDPATSRTERSEISGDVPTDVVAGDNQTSEVAASSSESSSMLADSTQSLSSVASDTTSSSSSTSSSTTSDSSSFYSKLKSIFRK
jgi:prepilin-type N-terminal cleavage/methylation domain-containing protein